MATAQKKDCDYCRRDGLQILPLRYAVAYGKNDNEAKALDALAPLSGLLGEGVTQTALTKSHYTTRLLRAGYLYPVVNRKGTLRCETVYSVSHEGFLRPTPWNDSKPNDHQPCQPGVCGINASTISIKEAKDVTEVFILFSPVPLSPALLNEYIKKSHAKTQSFKPKDWIDGKQNQKHTLQATEWRKTIAEFAALDHPELLNCFKPNEVFFPFYGGPGQLPAANEIIRQKARLEGLEKKFLCEKNLMTVVLHDPLGITQELNQARNQVYNFYNEQMMAEPFTPVKEKLYWGFDADADPDISKIEKERKEALDIAYSTPPLAMGDGIDPYGTAGIDAYYDGKRKRLIKEKEAALKQKPSVDALIYNRDAAQVALLLTQLQQQWDLHRLAMTGSYFDNQYEIICDRSKVIIQTDPDWAKKVGKPGYYRGRIYKDETQWKFHLQSLKNRSSQLQQVTAKNNKIDWKEKYASLYNYDAVNAFQDRSHAALDKGRLAATEKTKDHLTWLQSPKLIAALEWYDTSEPSWCVAYTSEVGHALSGVVGTKEGLALLQKWAAAEKIEHNNLLLRALVFAQKEVETALKYDGPASPEPSIAWAKVHKNVSTVVKYIDKAHSVMDAFAKGKDFPITMSANAYGWLKDIHMSGHFELMENLYGIMAKLPTEKLSLPFVSAIVCNLGSNTLNKIQLSTWMRAIDPKKPLLQQRLSSPSEFDSKKLEQEFDSLKQEKNTKWASLRIGTVLALLEVWNLKNKMDKLPEGSEKVRLEYAAALLTTSAAGLELCGRGIDLVGARSASLTEAAAKTAGGGLKLVSGSLGAIAGLVGILVDVGEKNKAAQKNQNTLVLLYKTRIAFQIGIIGTTALSAYAASAPFIKYVAEQVTSTRAKQLLARAIFGAEWIAAGRSFLVIGGFWLAVGTIAVTIVIAYLEDDTLQAYLRRSVWRLPESKEPPFENLKKEIQELGSAFQGIA